MRPRAYLSTPRCLSATSAVRFSSALVDPFAAWMASPLSSEEIPRIVVHILFLGELTSFSRPEKTGLDGRLITFPNAVEIALGDLSDPVSVAEAIKGVDKLFLLIGREGVPVELTHAVTAYGLAKKAGLKHVTFVSVFSADQFLEVPHFANKHAVEEVIRAGGMSYTILRPAYFAQNERSFRNELTGFGVYPVPAGNQGLAVVDLRDLAEAAAISLTEEGHSGKTYDLVSSEMLRGPDAAAIWSKLLGKEIAYAGHADFDGFEAQLREKGSPNWLAYDLRVMFQGFVENGFSNTEDQAARFAALIGRQPRTYSSFAEELATEWAAA